MPSDRPLGAQVYGHAPTVLRGRIEELDRGARVRRTARVTLPLLGLALVSLPIPGWHFIGTGGGLIAAAVLSVRRMRQRRRVLGVAGPCPACGEEVTFSVPETAHFPDTFPCPECAEFVQITPSAIR
ncbi:MAG: hypothetical protein ACE5IL_08755 [Myxococcota bacterium]